MHFYLQLENHNGTAAYNRIKNMLENNINYANLVYSGAEFYGGRHTIHRGITFKLGGYLIDTDDMCEPIPRYRLTLLLNKGFPWQLPPKYIFRSGKF